MDFYNTIEKEGSAEFKEKGSTFIAYAYPFKNVALLKEHLQKLKKEHKKAVHFCFAYRIGYDGNVFRSSDDGEPSGTAGKPILGQIDSKNLTDVLVVVVRYFGGTLLGVPGLINAYKSVSSMVLQVIPQVKKPILISYKIRFEYTQTNEIITLLRKYACDIAISETQLFPEIKAGIPKQHVREALFSINSYRNIEIIPLV